VEGGKVDAPFTEINSMTHGVKYIGSKAALLDEIVSFVEEHVPGPARFLDVFTGTTRVAQAFRAKGWTVASSDLSWAAEAYAHAFLVRTADSGARIPALIEELRSVPAAADWLTKSYCDVIAADGGIVKMWTPANGAIADAMRNTIAEWKKSKRITHHESMILVACLIFALDRVDSSVGVQQAYLKSWATRAKSPIDLKDLPFPAGPRGSHNVGDALKIVYGECDVAYIDPPYSPHSYATYYHIWDSITRWDKPAVGLKTNRRADRISGLGFDDKMHSPWNSKKEALQAFLELIERLPAKAVVISYSDESLVPLDKLESALKELYTVHKKVIPYKRNIMSQIGNAEAAITAGATAKTSNHEILLWITKHS
jgi:adenine-specific DNA-methyltransferase